MPSSLHQGGDAERDTIAASCVDTSAVEGRRRSEGTALGSVSATVIVPFHRGIQHLSACLAAIRVSLPDTPLIVAADGAREPLAPLCAAYDATIVEIPGGPAGPAVARNRAAEHATGDILLFVDADVVVAPDALPGMRTVLESEPHLAAVFGAYDHRPTAPGLVSQFKNLAHTYVHERGQRSASTFWAGLGAVRREAFLAVGGFDERFRRPSIEDVDLGQRMSAAGRTLRLDTRFRGTHLKRWTLLGCVRTDVCARGIPWVQLIHRSGAIADDLNTTMHLRLSVVAAYGTLTAVVAAWWHVVGLIALVPSVAALLYLNRDFYMWCARCRGWTFAAAVVPLHFVHHLCNGISFAIGSLLYIAARAGTRLPGTLPLEPWALAADRRESRIP